MEGVVGNIMDIFFDIIGEKVLGEGYRIIFYKGPASLALGRGFAAPPTPGGGVIEIF